MRRGSYTERVRQAARSIQDGGHTIDMDRLEAALGVQTYDERQRLRSTVSDLRKSKELQSLTRGVYKLVEKQRPPERQEVMWRFFRMQKTLSIDDLIVVADTTREYAHEFVTNLVNIGVARKFDNGRYQLIKAPLEIPLNDAKAEKLRKIRQRKKERLALALKKATIACSKAIRFLEDEGN